MGTVFSDNRVAVSYPRPQGKAEHANQYLPLQVTGLGQHTGLGYGRPHSKDLASQFGALQLEITGGWHFPIYVASYGTGAMLELSTGLLPEEPCQCGRENGRGQRRSLETDVGLQDTEQPGTLREELCVLLVSVPSFMFPPFTQALSDIILQAVSLLGAPEGHCCAEPGFARCWRPCWCGALFLSVRPFSSAATRSRPCRGDNEGF